MSVIPALRRLKQEDYEVEVSLGNTVNSRQASVTFQGTVSNITSNM